MKYHFLDKRSPITFRFKVEVVTGTYIETVSNVSYLNRQLMKSRGHQNYDDLDT